MRSCLWKLEPGFCTNGWIRLLGSIGPNVVSRSQPIGSRHFWDYIILLDLSHDSWENEFLFVKIRARVLDLWLDTSSRPNSCKCSFYTPDPKVNFFFWDFIILLDSSHDSWENEALFVTIDAMVEKISTRTLELYANSLKQLIL